MERRPRILASFVKSVLDGADRRDRRLGERVRARLDQPVRTALEAAGPVSFVPVELDVSVTEALFAEAGEECAREILRDNLLATFDAPILSSFIAGALRLLGRDPARLFGWSTKVWGQLYRDCGSIRFLPTGDGAGRLELADLPACIAASRPYLSGLEAAFDAGFALLDLDGTVRLAATDRASRADFELAWK